MYVITLITNLHVGRILEEVNLISQLLLLLCCHCLCYSVRDRCKLPTFRGHVITLYTILHVGLGAGIK